jgi:hypothetical protein
MMTGDGAVSLRRPPGMTEFGYGQGCRKPS